jgi:hypothetical protein
MRLGPPDCIHLLDNRGPAFLRLNPQDLNCSSDNFNLTLIF